MIYYKILREKVHFCPFPIQWVPTCLKRELIKSPGTILPRRIDQVLFVKPAIHQFHIGPV